MEKEPKKLTERLRKLSWLLGGVAVAGAVLIPPLSAILTAGAAIEGAHIGALNSLEEEMKIRRPAQNNYLA